MSFGNNQMPRNHVHYTLISKQTDRQVMSVVKQQTKRIQRRSEMLLGW